jgi:hypothetical protein
MDDPDREPDPTRYIPGVLWLLLGIGVVVLFAAVVMMLGGHVFMPRAVGPPAGTP